MDSWLGYGNDVAMAHCPAVFTKDNRKVLIVQGWNENYVNLIPYVWDRTQKECPGYSIMWKTQYSSVRQFMRVIENREKRAMDENIIAVSRTFLNEWILSHHAERKEYSFLPILMKRETVIEPTVVCMNHFLEKIAFFKRLGLIDEIFTMASVMTYLFDPRIRYSERSNQIQDLLLSYSLERHSRSYFLSIIDSVKDKHQRIISDKKYFKEFRILAEEALEKISFCSDSPCELELLLIDVINKEQNAIEMLQTLYVLVDSLSNFFSDFDQSIRVILTSEKEEKLIRMIHRTVAHMIYQDIMILVKYLNNSYPIGIANAVPIWDNLNHLFKTIAFVPTK